MALPALQAHFSNRLLQVLPPVDQQSILSVSEPVDLPSRFALYPAGMRPRYAYFMTSGVASVVSQSSDGFSAEVGIIGREGLVGAIHLLGMLPLPTSCFMQVAGSAIRIPFPELEQLFRSSLPLNTRILEFVQMRAINAAQLALCNALHTVERRLARWLLVVRDRLQCDSYDITHEFLADMLVTHRPTVSVAAAAFQRDGLISYRHGHIHILDRAGLQSQACDCYRISSDLLQHLYS